MTSTRRRRGWAGRAPQTDAGVTLEGVGVGVGVKGGEVGVGSGFYRYDGAGRIPGVSRVSRSLCTCRGGKEIGGEKLARRAYILYDALILIKDLK